MRRLFLGAVVIAALVACNESTPTGTRAGALDRTRSTLSTASTLDDLDAEIAEIIAYWPKALAKSFTSKWNDVKKLYVAGQTNPTKLAEAKKKLSELATLILKNAALADPPGAETPDEATQRLILDMVLYVYGGDPGGDNATGLLTPDDPLTLVTPNAWAGVHFDEGSTDVNRIIVITQNPKTDYAICDGPLLTELCQYPLFYDIQSFPGGRLLKVAEAAICHPPENTLRGPSSYDHGDLRLAHTKPAKVADYTPGGSVRNTPPSEENIEILPLISQTFLTLPACEGVDYPPLEEEGPVTLWQHGVHLATSFASRVGRFLTPKSAYAIDQGGGGGFLDFSPFNNVDICSGPTPEPSCGEID